MPGVLIKRGHTDTRAECHVQMQKEMTERCLLPRKD